jgi:hypothetical protein
MTRVATVKMRRQAEISDAKFIDNVNIMGPERSSHWSTKTGSIILPSLAVSFIEHHSFGVDHAISLHELQIAPDL